MRFFKAFSIILVLLLCVTTLRVPAYTAETETPLVLNEATDIAPTITGLLESKDDICTYDMEIDHSLYPEAILYAFAYHGTGNLYIAVRDEDGKLVGHIYLLCKLSETGSDIRFTPKSYCTISSTENTVKKYTVTVKALSENAGYALNIGTEDTAVENFAGRSNVTTVLKNYPSKNATEIMDVSFYGYQMLLNDGEWFHYTADGYTYITAIMKNCDSLAFDVYDAETLQRVYHTKQEDHGTKDFPPVYYNGYVQKGLNLVDGKDYFIRVYSTEYISGKTLSDTYTISIGLPYLDTEKISYSSSKRYYVPANRMTTFTIDVTDSKIPSHARLGNNTNVIFSADSSMNNTYVTYCRITTPNGITVTPTNGRYQGFPNPSSVNFLTNPNHIPVHGTWKVTVKTEKALNFNFGISGYYNRIMGNP